MNYIDADLLKKEIERHIKQEVEDAAKRFTPNVGFLDAIFDSFQQERQEEPDKTFEETLEDDYGNIPDCPPLLRTWEKQ